jgi:hypothetical protein
MPDTDIYRPQLDEAVWAEVEEFVTESVSETAPRTPYPERELMQAFSRLVVWGREAGIPMEQDALLSEATIAAFIEHGLPTYAQAGRANRRSQLRAMRSALGRMDSPKPEPLPAADPSAPYTEGEIRRLRRWARAQSTDEYRRDALSILSLGIGGGLSAGEIADIQGASISIDAQGVRLIVLATRPRTVQVRREWEEPLIEHARSAKPTEFLIRPDRKASSRNFLSNLVDRSAGPEFRPQSQRMRATWIVEHLTLGAPMGVLMDAAGVQSLEAFTRFMTFVPGVATREARALLRG